MNKTELGVINGHVGALEWRGDQNTLDKALALDTNTQASFMGATYTVERLAEPLDVYRFQYYDQNNVNIGNFWSPVPPSGDTQYAIDAAMKPEFYENRAIADLQNQPVGSTAEHAIYEMKVIEYTIPEGSIIYRGEAAPQTVRDESNNQNIPPNIIPVEPCIYLGGQEQIYLPWRVSERDIPAENIMTMQDFQQKQQDKQQQQQQQQQGQQDNLVETLQVTNLVDSFNATHPENPVPKQGTTSSDIGGVGNKVGIIEGLKDSVAEVLEDQHIFVLPSMDEQQPFSNHELQQILRELSVGIFIHDTVPFFSLHFNANGTMYPVIHPAYQKTLIGEVIGKLDYIMKGFLNGGIFNDNYIKQWLTNPTTDSVRDISQAINFDVYCKNNGISLPYQSLREKMVEHGVTDFFEVGRDEQGRPIHKAKFNTSFRIIAKQNSIKKSDNVFVLDPDFDIEYTIDKLPEYESYLRQYRVEHGDEPEEWKTIQKIYGEMAQDIKAIMPKLPLCRAYFAKLAVINFFCYYFKTLKDMQRVPVLNSINKTPYQFPELLPPLPTRFPKAKELSVTISQLIRNLSTQQLSTLSSYIVAKSRGYNTALDSNLLNFLKSELRNILNKTFCNEQNDDMVSKLLNELFEDLSEGLKTSGKELNASLTRQRNELENLIKDAKNKLVANYWQQKSKIDNIENQDVNNLNNQLRNIPTNYGIDQQALSQARKSISDNKASNIQRLNQGYQEQLAKIEGAYQKGLTELSTEQQRISQLLNFPLANKEITRSKCRLTIKGVTFEIPETTYYQTTNENFRLLGGCGVRLNSLPFNSSLEGKMISQQSLKTIGESGSETFSPITINNKAYQAFKLTTSHFPASKNHNYLWLENTFTTQENSPELHVAVLNNNSKKALSLIRTKEDLLITTPQGETVFHHAARLGLNGMLIELLKKLDKQQLVIALNKPMKNGATPLYLSVMNGHHQTVNMLLKLKVNSNAKLTNDMTPLHCAFHHRHELCALALLQDPNLVVDAQLEDGTTALFIACQFNMVQGITELLKRHANINHQRKDKKTPLLTAVSANNLEVVKLLLNNQTININLALDYGITALHIAAEKGFNEILAELLSHQANPNLVDKNNETALMAAIRNGNVTAAVMLARVTNLSIENNYKERAYHLAAQKGLFDVITQSMELTPADILKTDRHGWTLLHYFIVNGRYDLFEFYFNKLSVTHQRNYPMQKEWISLALKYGQKQMVSYFLRKNFHSHFVADPKNQENVLQYAAFFGYLDLLQEGSMSILLRKDVEAPYFAALGGQVATLRWLLQQKNERECPPDQLLFAAVTSGDKQTIDEILLKLSEPNQIKDDEGETFIHIAARLADPELLYFLRQRGADFQARNNSGKTVFHLIAQFDLKEAWKYLINKKEPFTLPDDLSYFLAENSLYDYLEDVVSIQPLSVDYKDPKSGNNVLHAAVKSGDSKTILWLVDKFPHLLEQRNLASQTPLMLAVQLNKTVSAEILIHCGAKKEVDPLMDVAVKAGSLDAIKMLLDNGISLDKKTIHLAPKKLQPIIKDLSQINDLVQQYCTALLKNDSKLAICLANNFIDEYSDVNFPVQLKLSSGTLKGSYNLLSLAILLNQKTSLDYLVKQHRLLERHDEKTNNLINKLSQESLVVINHLIKRGYSLHLADENGITPLHLLAADGLEDCLKYINEKNAQLDEKDNKGFTPLHVAMLGNHVSTLDLLRKKGANLLAKTKDGLNSAHFAAATGHIESIKWCLKNNIPSNLMSQDRFTPLALAISKGHKNIVDILCRTGLNINSTVGEEQLSYLHLAIDAKQPEIALGILEFGIDCHLTDIHKRTALHCAAERGMTTLISSLVARGLDINAPDDKGYTPLHYAASSHNPDAVSLLLELGAKTSIGTQPKEFPWIEETVVTNLYPQHIAARHGDVKSVKLLIENGASPQAKDSVGSTLLPYAIASGSKEMLELCEQYQLITTDKEESSAALIMAVTKDRVEVLEKLQNKGISLNDHLSIGETPLQLASRFGSSRVTQFLTEKNVNVQATNLSGNNALTEAVKNGHISEFRILIKKLPPKELATTLNKLFATAVKSSHAAIVVELLRTYKINVNQKDPTGQSMLHLAALHNPEAIPYLLAAAADPWCETSDKRTADQLTSIAKYQNLIKQYQKAWKEKPIEVSLHRAIRLNNKKGFWFLIKSTNPHLVDAEGNNAVHVAVGANANWALNFLQMSHLNFAHENKQGELPSFLALKNYSEQELNELEMKGFSFLSPAKSGMTPLNYCESNHLPIATNWLNQKYRAKFIDAFNQKDIKQMLDLLNADFRLSDKDLLWHELAKPIHVRCLVLIAIYMTNHSKEGLSFAAMQNTIQQICLDSLELLHSYDDESYKILFPYAYKQAGNDEVFVKLHLQILKKIFSLASVTVINSDAVFDSVIKYLKTVKTFNFQTELQSIILDGIFNHKSTYIRKILSSGLVNSIPLHWFDAASKNDSIFNDLAHHMDLQLKIDPNYNPRFWTSQNPKECNTVGMILLHKAVSFGLLESVNYLLQQNVGHIDQQVNGKTLLDRAVGNGAMVNALIRAGANPYLVDAKGKTIADSLSAENREILTNHTKERISRTTHHSIDVNSAASLIRLMTLLISNNDYPSASFLINHYFDNKSQPSIFSNINLRAKLLNLENDINKSNPEDKAALTYVVNNSKFRRVR